MNANQVPQTSGNSLIDQGISHDHIITRIAAPFPVRFGQALQLPEQRAGIAGLEHYEQDMAEFQALHEESLRETRRTFIFASDEVLITEFLSQHRSIPQLLLESFVPLGDAFGSEVRFEIRASVEDGTPRLLYVIAPWARSVAHARAALARFDENWWLAHSYQAAGLLSYNYELI